MCPEVTQFALSFTFGLQTLGMAHSKAFLGMFCPAKDLVPGYGMGVRKASRLTDKALKARSDDVGSRQKKQHVQTKEREAYVIANKEGRSQPASQPKALNAQAGRSCWPLATEIRFIPLILDPC